MGTHYLNVHLLHTQVIVCLSYLNDSIRLYFFHYTTAKRKLVSFYTQDIKCYMSKALKGCKKLVEVNQKLVKYLKNSNLQEEFCSQT